MRLKRLFVTRLTYRACPDDAGLRVVDGMMAWTSTTQACRLLTG